jgi:hypothetical protein
MDFDITRKKINIFKIGKLYCFKHYFNDREVFEGLSKYYNEENYRFECTTVGERNKIIKYLWKMGFDAVLVENPSEYIVKMDRTKRYAPILKYSIEQAEIGNNNIFLMKDMASVELATEHGAEKYTDKTESLFEK